MGISTLFKGFFAGLCAITTLIACGGSSDSNDGAPPATVAESCQVIGLNPKIIGGGSCASPETASVVRVVEVIGDDASGICTGSLVTPNVVLTAAHCINDTAFQLGAARYVVITGEPGSAQGVAVDAISIAPSYGVPEGADRLFNDAALVRLSKPLNTPPLPILGSRAPKEGEAGFVYGYGKRTEGDNDTGLDAATLEAGAMTIQTVTPNHIFVEFQQGGVNVCNGDSGGPLVVLIDGRPAIAGVVSQGSIVGCYPGDITTFTNLQEPQVQAWLGSLSGIAWVR